MNCSGWNMGEVGLIEGETMKTIRFAVWMTILAILALAGPGSAADLKPIDVLSKEAIKPQGKYYEATVPDTLDLAERARASINPMINIIEPDQHHYSWTNVLFGKPVRFHPLTWNLPCEYIFCLFKKICG